MNGQRRKAGEGSVKLNFERRFQNAQPVRSRCSEQPKSSLRLTKVISPDPRPDESCFALPSPALRRLGIDRFSIQGAELSRVIPIELGAAEVHEPPAQALGLSKALYRRLVYFCGN